MQELTEEIEQYLEDVRYSLVPQPYRVKIHDIIFDILYCLRHKRKDKLPHSKMYLYKNSGMIELYDNGKLILEENYSESVLQKSSGIYVDIIEVKDSVLYFYSKGDILQEYNTHDIDKSFLFNISTVFCQHLLIGIAFALCINAVRPSYYLVDMQYLIEYLGEEYVRDEDS